MIRDCTRCLYWSDLVAEQVNTELLMALCENPGGPKEGQMVAESDGCPSWEGRDE